MCDYQGWFLEGLHFQFVTGCGWGGGGWAGRDGAGGDVHVKLVPSHTHALIKVHVLVHFLSL